MEDATTSIDGISAYDTISRAMVQGLEKVEETSQL